MAGRSSSSARRYVCSVADTGLSRNAPVESSHGCDPGPTEGRPNAPESDEVAAQQGANTWLRPDPDGAGEHYVGDLVGAGLVRDGGVADQG